MAPATVVAPVPTPRVSTRTAFHGTGMRRPLGIETMAASVHPTGLMTRFSSRPTDWPVRSTIRAPSLLSRNISGLVVVVVVAAVTEAEPCAGVMVVVASWAPAARAATAAVAHSAVLIRVLFMCNDLSLLPVSPDALRFLSET
jgi:hypothetical protein